MVDHISKERRSWNMSRIGSKDTAPEIFVRSMLHKMGLRFRLHRADLPGIPDIVLPKYRTVVFVHGCFWHQHKGCRRSGSPKSNTTYWHEKLAKNVKRDRKHRRALAKLGWKVILVWECEVGQPRVLRKRFSKIRICRDK